MLRSWHTDSNRRPTFATLKQDLCQAIDDLERAVDTEKPASEIHVPAASSRYLELISSSNPEDEAIEMNNLGVEPTQICSITVWLLDAVFNFETCHVRV